MKLKFTKGAIAVMASAMILSACSGGKEGSVKELEVTEFSELIEKQDTIVLLDVSGDQYGDILITGAVAYPVNNEEDAVAIIQKYGTATPYAVYDINGSKSKNVADMLAKKGANVYTLKNGLINWIEEDEEIVIMPIDSTMQAPIKTTKSQIMTDSVLMQKLNINK